MIYRVPRFRSTVQRRHQRSNIPQRYYSRQYIEDTTHHKPEDYETITLPVPNIHKLENRFDFNASRSSGPGGQHVNKTNSKVELRFNLHEADWLDRRFKDNFVVTHPQQVTKRGEVVIVSQKHRNQHENKRDCLNKLQEMLEDARVIPPKHLKTSPVPVHIKEKRKADKQHRKEKKQNRGKVKME